MLISESSRPLLNFVKKFNRKVAQSFLCVTLRNTLRNSAVKSIRLILGWHFWEIGSWG